MLSILTGVTIVERSRVVSAPRIRVQSLSIPQVPAGLSTFLARALLAGFALFILALATHGA